MKRASSLSSLSLGVTLLVGGISALPGCEASSEPAAAAGGELNGGAADCVLDPDGLPSELRCTGLYADGASLVVNPAARAFEPGFQLWSDGAEKSRWIMLPPGTTIDARDMSRWDFPVGTKLWKEFRLPIDGVERRIETRLLWKRETGWAMTKYVWNDAGDAAVRTKPHVGPVAGTNGYEMPSDGECRVCHSRNGIVLGFSAVLLAAPEASGFTYEIVKAEGLLPPEAPEASALKLPGAPLEREVLGRLYASCGVSCHAAPNMYGRLSMTLPIVDGKTPESFRDTPFFRAVRDRGYVVPKRENDSLLYLKMAHRGPGQMPPLGTNLRDEETLGVVRDWIQSLDAPSAAAAQ